MLKNSIVGAIVLAVAGPAGSALAQDGDVGKAIYEQYCATCHGLTGEGDGPLTEYMLEKVADLTALSAGNDGTFPMLKVIHIIDGRTGLRGHGGPMPTYGDVFMAESATGTPGDFSNVLETRGRVLSVAQYLETIQK